jgi:hypothetical protein
MVRLWQFAKVPGAIIKYGAKFLQYHDNLALAKTPAWLSASTLYGKGQWCQVCGKS